MRALAVGEELRGQGLAAATIERLQEEPVMVAQWIEIQTGS